MSKGATLAGGVGALWLLLDAPPANAQADAERLLADVSVAGAADCPLYTIRFAVPIRLSGVTSQSAVEARVAVAPAASGAFRVRDELAVPGDRLIETLRWEADAPGGAHLILTWSGPARVEVTLGHDANSLVVKAIRPGAACTQDAQAAPAPTPLDPAAAAAHLTRAEQAILVGDWQGAEDALAPLLSAPDGAQSARALELSGLVRQRRGDHGGARRANGDYLRRFADDPGVARVRARLADLPAETNASSGNSGERRWRSTVSGTISQFYSRDTSSNRFIDARRPDPAAEVDRRINIDQLLSSTDIIASATDGDTRIGARLAMSYTSDFRPVTLVGSSRSAGDDTARIAAFYVDLRHDPIGLSARVGRQSLYGSGVFGRFDGARFGQSIGKAITVHLQAGFPVPSTRLDRMVRDRKFYGMSVEWSPPGRPFGVELYWHDQRSHGLIDRQSVGVQARYLAGEVALFGLVDLDVAFGRISRAYLSATAPLAGGTIAIRAEQQHVPALSISNAVIGQPLPRLVEVERLFDLATLRQMARDRSPISRSIDVGYTRPVGARWTLQLDAAVSATARAPASAGVAEIAGSGTEFHGAAQLVGVTVGPIDTLIGRVQVARAARFTVLSGEVAARVSLGSRLAIEPRLTLAKRADRFGSGQQLAWRGQLRATYQSSSRLAFDAEVGRIDFRQRQDDAAFVGRNRERSTFFNLGYRWTF